MKLSFLLLTLLFATQAYSQTKFPMGDGMEKWGLPIVIPESEIALRLGGRYQSLASITTTEDEDGNSFTKQDFFSRRVRFQFEAVLPNKILFNMDIRNDNANRGDAGEQKFNIGDAYVQIPLSTSNDSVHALRLYRAKVDVSRTQTVSSSELIFVNRPFVADEAAQFVNHNRRATNVQVVGQVSKKLTYQLALGDGVQSDAFNDAQGNSLVSIERQNFMVGGKLRFHPFEGWSDLKPSETYFGEGKLFSFGAGFFNTSNINIEATNATDTISRNLTNFEATANYHGWFLTGEYFIFDGVVENHEAQALNVGKSEGYYIQGEKVLPDFHFLAPFARYEKWDRFLSGGDYLTVDKLYGVNWYLNGNRFKVSLAYQHTDNGDDTGLSKESEAYHIATAWHF
jgi:hypothetical protein